MSSLYTKFEIQTHNLKSTTKFQVYMHSISYTVGVGKCIQKMSSLNVHKIYTFLSLDVKFKHEIQKILS